MKNFKLLILAFSILLVSSCSKDHTDVKPSSPSLIVNASEYNVWKYYKLSTDGKLEFVADGVYDLSDKSKIDMSTDGDWKKRSDWDIAFNQYNIRTNSGESGNNKGGLFKTTLTNLTGFSLDKVSDLSFTEDKTAVNNIILGLHSMPPPQGSVSMSALHPVQIIMTTMPPKYNISPNVFVLKTLSGFVAFKVKTFYSSKGEIGVLSIDYVDVK